MILLVTTISYLYVQNQRYEEKILSLIGYFKEDSIKPLLEHTPDQELIKQGEDILAKQYYFKHQYPVLMRFISPYFLMGTFTLFTLILFIYLFLNYKKQKDEEEVLKLALLNVLTKQKTEMPIKKTWQPMIQQLTYQMDVKQQQIIHKDEALTSIIQRLTHQIKTPLTALTLYTSLADLKNQQKQIERIEKVVDRLSYMVKLQNKDLKLNFEYILLEDMIQQCLEGLSYESYGKIYYVPQDITMYVDEFWFTQMLMNILKNSKECSRNTYIHTLQLENEIIIEISNDGDKLEEEELSLIFKPFYTKARGNKKEGLGIGLNIAYQVVCLHFGHIQVNNSDKGVMFSIHIPIIKASQKVTVTKL